MERPPTCQGRLPGNKKRIKIKIVDECWGSLPCKKKMLTMFTSHSRHCEDRTESRLSTSSSSSTSSPRKTCLGKPLTSSTPAHSAAQISSIVSSNHREAHVSSIASSDQHGAQISSGLVGPGSDQVLLTQNSGSGALVEHHHDYHQYHHHYQVLPWDRARHLLKPPQPYQLPSLSPSQGSPQMQEVCNFN